VLSTDDIRRLVATLRQNGAPPRKGGMFDGVIDPFVEADISKDPTFQTAASYSNIGTLKDFVAGRWMGVEWSRSNGIPILSLMPMPSWATVTTATTGFTGGNGFLSGSTVLVRITRVDPMTGFETVISADQTASTGTGAFAATVTLNGAAPTGTYKIYSTLQNGAAGTATLQVRMRHTAGATDGPIYLVASGAP